MAENVILVDFDANESWEFCKAIETATGEKWKVEKCISNKNHSGAVQNLIRYIKYFVLPFKITLHKKNYKRVVAWQQFFGLILAFYFRLFRMKNVPEITVMTFIYKPKRSFIGRIYERFIRYIVTSGYIKQYIVFSEGERELYSNLFNVAKEKFYHVKLGHEDVTVKIPIEKPQDYYLSAGRSNRDYSFLISVWGDRSERLKIICDSPDCSLTKKQAESIEILTDCHGDEYFKLLAGCYSVVIALENEDVSSGQLVMLQAMMYGKPVIVTGSNTAADYITNGKDGLIIPKTREALNEALAKLKNEEVYRKISGEARSKYEKNFSIYSMGIKVGNLLRK